VFSMEWDTDGGRRGVFIKVPKSQVVRQSVWPAVEADWEMGRREYDSLTRLAEAWTGVEGDGRFVEPVTFIPELNAIVTHRCYGGDLLHRFRAESRRLRRGSPVERAVRTLGRALRQFHDHVAGPTSMEWDVERARVRVGTIAAAVEARGVRVPCHPDRWTVPKGPVRTVQSLKGLDIRNVLIDAAGRLTLLDPGRMKADVPESDLGRLIVTCRLVHWGRLWFFSGKTPDIAYERAVLDAYGADGYDQTRLRWCVAKELLKHWRAAFAAVDDKPWPALVKAVACETYINPFYQRQLRLMDRLLTSVSEG
jgi:hypothetical protein